MDEIDLIIIRKLIENSRLTFRELAEITTMSVSTIHKRIQNLINEGTINAFIVRPTMISLKGLWIMASGASNAKSMDLVSQELGNHESINLVTIASGKYLYISAYLRNISELQEFTSFLTKTSQISDPSIGIINIPYITTPETLSTVDYKILKALNRNARKALTNVLIGWIYIFVAIGLIFNALWAYTLAMIPGTVFIYHGLFFWVMKGNQNKSGQQISSNSFRITWFLLNFVTGVLTIVIAL